MTRLSPPRRAAARRAAWALAAVFLTASPATAQLLVEDWRVQEGDRPEYALPGFDDSSWPPERFFEVEGAPGIQWMRSRVVIPPALAASSRPLGVQFAAIATCELFWDGELLAQEGRPGATAAAEEPGPIAWTVYVPERLSAAGAHTLALRCSSHHRGFRPSTGFWYVALADYGALLEAGRTYTWKALLSLSGMVLIGLYALVLFFLDRRDRSFLLLGLLCITAAALLVAESWRALFGYTYDWHLTRLVTLTALAWLVAVELMVFLVQRFPLPGRRLWLALTMVVATVPLFLFRAWDPKSAVPLLATFVLAEIWVIRALRQRLPGSLLATIGVTCGLAILLIEPPQIVDQLLYLALDVLLVFLLAAHALQVRRTRRERREALLRSSRLEAELLKRSIQPHFLMNTLTALTEWLEEEPAVAVEMIEALAEELRLLGEIADRRLIRVEDELRLCRAHLEVMSRRKDCQYRLEEDGVAPAATLPPAVLHTLVENAITHQPAGAEGIEFVLRQESRGGDRLYRLEARPVAANGEAGMDGQRASGPVMEGTGLRYIRARLEESYGGGFSLRSGPGAGGWWTELVVPGTGVGEASA